MHGHEIPPIMKDALVILGAAGIVIPLFARFKVTPIIGFILVGLAVGPYGLGRMIYEFPFLEHVTITDPERLEPFAEFGIILLLFAIGLELSFNRLWQMRKLVFGLGALELLIISSLLAALLSMFGQFWTGAIGLGPGARAVLHRAGAPHRGHQHASGQGRAIDAAVRRHHDRPNYFPARRTGTLRGERRADADWLIPCGRAHS